MHSFILPLKPQGTQKDTVNSDICFNNNSCHEISKHFKTNLICLCFDFLAWTSRHTLSYKCSLLYQRFDIYIYICVCVRVCVCLSVCLFVCLSVCVKRLNRRKTSLPAHFYTLYFIKAGDHWSPGGVGDQPRHLPGTRVNVPAGLWWCTWAHLSRSWWPP